MALLVLAVTPAGAGVTGAPPKGPAFVSVCGDPGMVAPEPRLLLEGWNFCNRCGRACDVAPRWADCVAANGSQLVSVAANALGLPQSVQSQPSCDALTEEKERELGDLCAHPNALGEQTYFWTLMLKSGAMNVSERGHLCGLWCADKQPSCNPGSENRQQASAPPPPSLPWLDSNYNMRQPRVKHVWSAKDPSTGGYSGAFYGTFDPVQDLSKLATPAEAIASVHHTPADRSPCRSAACNVAGRWLGNGDATKPLVVTQAAGSGNFTASCGFTGPASWHNQAGESFATGAIELQIETHTDRGFILDTNNSKLICWATGSVWCREGHCPADPSILPHACAAHGVTPSSAIPSYFGFEWFVRDGRRIFRHIERAGHDLRWIMLCTQTATLSRFLVSLP